MHGDAIGKAATLLLTDHEVLAFHRAEARQWLAVLADEFSERSPQQMINALSIGDAIEGSTICALIARLGASAPRVSRRNRIGFPPPGAVRPEQTDFETLYRATADVNETICVTCTEAMLRGEALDEGRMRAAGDTGSLVSIVLGFCLRGELQPEQLPLANALRLRGKDPRPCRDRLLSAWQMIYDEMRFFDADTRGRYVAELERRISSSSGELLCWGSEVLRFGVQFRRNIFAQVLEEYVGAPWAYDWEFGRELARWCVTLDEDGRTVYSSVIEAAVAAADSAEFDGHGLIDDRDRRLLVIALAFWVVCRQRTRPAARVFRRGVAALLRNHVRAAETLADIEPLVLSVSSGFIADAARGADEPEVRSLVRLAELWLGLRTA